MSMPASPGLSIAVGGRSKGSPTHVTVLSSMPSTAEEGKMP